MQMHKSSAHNPFVIFKSSYGHKNIQLRSFEAALSCARAFFKMYSVVTSYGIRGWALQVLKEAPDRNYFSIPSLIVMHLNSCWELFHSVFILRFQTGFRSSLLSQFLVCIGLIFPGPVSHSPINYVNSVRLGTGFPFDPSVRSNLDNFAVAEENVKGVFDSLRLHR